MTAKPKRWAAALAGLCAIVIVTSVKAEDAPTRILGSQAEVDAFEQSDVTGTLVISGDDIVDLGPLSSLRSVSQSVVIRGNGALANVSDAFPLLTTVGGAVVVTSNRSLLTFSGFASLTQTGDSIEVSLNESLTSVAGFGLLRHAGFSLEFVANPVLAVIPDFPSLETIGSSLFVVSNASLASIAGFASLQDVAFSFQVVGNRSLRDLCGLSTVLAADGSYAGRFLIADNHPSLPTPTSSEDILASCP